MTLYAIYNKDGSISQANKVYDQGNLIGAKGKPATYDDLLNERGLKFVKHPTLSHMASHDHFMVDVSAGQIKERPLMPIVYSSPIKAGSTAVISNIPKGSAVSISAVGMLLHSVPSMPGTDIDFITEPVPCTYTVMVRKWPYKDCVIKIEAVAK